MNGWNPHFVAYARSQGRTPETQADVDGHNMCKFIVWSGQRAREWRAEVGLTDRDYLTDGLLAGYAVWLDRWLVDHPGVDQLELFEEAK